MTQRQERRHLPDGETASEAGQDPGTHPEKVTPAPPGVALGAVPPPPGGAGAQDDGMTPVFQEP